MTTRSAGPGLLAWACGMLLMASACTTDTALSAGTSSPDAADVTHATATSTPGRQTGIDQPVRLALPDAGIDAEVTPAGLSSDDTISPPQGTLTWFTGQGRVQPGQLGTALIAGHISYQGHADVFSALHQVDVGDQLTLTGTDGKEQGWTVRSVDVLGKNELQTDARVWDAQRHTPRLALVTCDSALGFRDDGHRVANRVVVAEPTETEPAEHPPDSSR